MKKILFFLFICFIFGINGVNAKTIIFKDKELCETVYMTATWDGTNQADVIHNNCSSSKSVVFDRDDDLNMFDSIVISKKYVSLDGLDSFPNLNEISIYMDEDFDKFDLNDILLSKSLISNLEITCTSECSVANFEKISEFTNINDLEIYNVNVDLNAIGNLNGLNKLKVSNTKIIDTKFISSLTQLKELSLVNAKIFNINFLKNLTSLEKLNLTGNNIEDISIIKDLDSLNDIQISKDCNITLADGEEVTVEGNKCNKKDIVVENNDNAENKSLSNKYILIVSIITLIIISIVIVLNRKKKVI